ncbi:MAG: hypothetical protein NZM10_02240 [Fimbriimonadales bacterium]|nr:hypothetical protein [Fimbriimonadales bacterium]
MAYEEFEYEPGIEWDALSEYESPFAHDGDFADLMRDTEWDYEYSEGEWEYYGDLEREDFDG